jgi:hypothetical protein
MYIRLREPVVIFGDSPCERGQIVSVQAALAMTLVKNRQADLTGIADFNDPELEAFKERARRAGQAVDWDKEPNRARTRVSVIASAGSVTTTIPKVGEITRRLVKSRGLGGKREPQPKRRLQRRQRLAHENP